MNKLLILALLIPTVVIAQDKTWSWNPVTEATNGDKITVSGYKVYCSFGEFETNLNEYTHDLPPGEHSCKITAIYQDVESELSESAAITMPELVPRIPINITIKAKITITIE